MPLTNQSASNLIVPNVYVYVQMVLQAVNPYINTALNGFVGGANYGPVNEAVLCSGAAAIFRTYGNDTVGAGTDCYVSLVEEMLTALPEDGSGVGVRVTDGTDAAAVITMIDTQGSPGDVLVLTANFTGSLPNGDAAINVPAAQCRIDLVSGVEAASSGNSPVYRISIFFPNQTPEVFNNILGYDAASPDGYNYAYFVPNAIAAINGTAPNAVPSRNWTASAPVSQSTHVPKTAFLISATGGEDGTSGLTLADLVGTQTNPPTGMYALSGTGFFQLVLAGMNDLSFVPTMSSFVSQENAALAFATVPAGTSDSGAFGLRLTNAAVDNNVVLVKDYLQVYDTVYQTFRLVSPLGKAAGIIGLLPPYASPINQPWNTTGLSAGGVVATEQTLLGYPRSQDQLAALITNGFIAITNQIPINNGSFGIFDDVTSAGSPQTTSGVGYYIPDQRMTSFLALAFLQLGGKYVGQNQTTAANDPTRAAISAAYNNFLSQLKPNNGIQWIDSYSVTCDLTNNTPTTISEGYCFVQCLVRYLGVIRILYVTLQGGTNVQVSATPPPGYPGT